METLRGSSGVLHDFTHVSRGTDGMKVVDVCSSEASETDVMRLWIKALDVGAEYVGLVAPSYSPLAVKLAEEYGVKLGNSTRHSHMTLSRRRSGKKG